VAVHVLVTVADCRDRCVDLLQRSRDGLGDVASHHARGVGGRPAQGALIERPHRTNHSDLTELYAEGGYKGLWFDREDLEAHAERELVLSYPGGE